MAQQRQHRRKLHTSTLLPLQRPTPDDRKGWSEYWQTQNQAWRTEPEIHQARRQELVQRRTITPDIEQGIYPFKGMKLSRADIEWLLATHENGRGPIDWNDVSQHKREGLDLRGADLSSADLRSLPLARMQGGLSWSWPFNQTQEQYQMAAVVLEKADLREAQLQQATLNDAQLQQADLSDAQLQQAELSNAQLQQAILIGTQLQQADLSNAQLQQAELSNAQLQQANLFRAQLQQADLFRVPLQQANLRETELEKAHLNEVSFANAQGVGPWLADARWDGTNLAVVDWSPLRILGDEDEAKRKQARDGKTKTKNERLTDYKVAVRGNRQLAIALQGQGLNEDAARFAYRALKLQRVVLWQQRKPGQFLFSLFLDLLAGYGYRPGRSLVAYLIVIFGFMALYLLNAHFVTPHLHWDEALVLSLSSFHGRGFFSQDITLGDTYARLAASEAVIGLLIEVSLIATFTRRFFGN